MDEYFTSFLIGQPEILKILGDTPETGGYRVENKCDRDVLSLFGTEKNRRDIRDRLTTSTNALFFAEGNTTAGERLVSLLADRKMTICTAESCTGGMIAARITDVPGSSRVFWGGFVVYDNRAKRDVLGVRGVERYGAVSPEVVTEMASQALEKSGTDLSIAVSGIAGPGGGTEGKPVGTVFIGIGRTGRPPHWYRFSVAGSRHRVRSRTALACLLLTTGEVLEKTIDTVMLSNYI